MMTLGPRYPLKHQVHLHLEGKQKTLSQHHRQPSALVEAEGRNPATPEPRRKSRTGAPAPSQHTPTRGSLGPRHPRKPSHLHSSAASRPHCRDPTEFPVYDNDAISVREETHNKPGVRRKAGRSPRGPRHPPQRVRAPTGRVGAGGQPGAAEGPGGPVGRGQDRPAAEPLPTSRSGRRPHKCKRDQHRAPLRGQPGPSDSQKDPPLGDHESPT
uniref:proline-rich protein 2-like n=1 Tax=Callithrix jacchus TaxID=9483 RepID=UPI0023DD521A|nr:proline-rich protein 2-like [Callithrix jacchus]